MKLAIRESPAAISRSLPAMPSEAVQQPRYQIVIYARISGITSALAPKTANVLSMQLMPSTAKKTETRRISRRPDVISFAALPLFPLPRAWAAVVITPTPSPRNTHPISMITGNVNPIAASGIFPSCPTK